MKPFKYLLSWPVLIGGIILLLALSAIAVESGEDYKIASIECHNDLNLRIRGQYNLTDGEYEILGCNKYNVTSNKEEYWNCWCVNNTANIYLGTLENTSNIYDVFIQYYIGDEKNYSNKRIEEFNDIFVKKGVVKKEPLLFPKLEGSLSIGMTFGIIVLTILFLGVILVKWLMNDKDNQIGGMREKPLVIKKKKKLAKDEVDLEGGVVDLDDFLRNRNI